MIDNSDIQQKIKVREKGLSIFSYSSDPKIIDLYAGEGVIGERLWSHVSKDITSIEKDKDKCAKIKYGQVITGDNRDYISLTAYADIVDCDAYGLVFQRIKQIIEASRKRKIIFFTESNPFSKSIHTAIYQILGLENVKAFWIEKANSSNVFYGYILL